jgi:hypothetical protein
MDAAKPKLRWYRPTPDRLILGLLAVEAFLLLSQWGGWFPFNRHKGWTVLIDVAAVGSTIALLVVWFAVNVIFRRRFQYSLRSLLLLVVAVAVACSWLATEMQRARRQRQAVAAVVAMDGYVQCEIDPDAFPDEIAPNCPMWLKEFLGDDFFVKVVEVVVYKDTKLANLKALCELESLELCDPALNDAELVDLWSFGQLQFLSVHGTRITDAGLDHLNRMSHLKTLWLYDTAVTRNGVKKLKQALPNCSIYDVRWSPANPGAR